MEIYAHKYGIHNNNSNIDGKDMKQNGTNIKLDIRNEEDEIW